ncbi:MAG: hypothetical protein AB1767_07140 [Bacillota bacterium]
MKCSGVTSKKSAAFYVRIYFRQNASWQGTIRWLDGKKTVAFRSTLELAKLLSEALERDSAGTANNMILWENKEEVS